MLFLSGLLLRWVGLAVMFAGMFLKSLMVKGVGEA